MFSAPERTAVGILVSRRVLVYPFPLLGRPQAGKLSTPRGIASGIPRIVPDKSGLEESG